MKFWKIVRLIGAVVAGLYAVLWKFADTKPDEAQTNLTIWRSIALAILPAWLRTRLAAAIVALLICVPLIAWGIWSWLKRYPPFILWQQQRAFKKRTHYLSGRETGLQFAIYAMSQCSAWARWYSAQHLATQKQPIDGYSLVSTIANTMVLTELVDGTLTAFGRLPGQFKASPIPQHYWHYRCFNVEKDDRVLWKISLRDRNEISEDRKSSLPEYEDLIVNSQEFENLFPKSDPVTEVATRRFLKTAKAMGLVIPEILK
ncbi:MAG: hypothetical protein ACLQJ0_04955 [Steroidobacteraceae bacterium]|jgi:hypothetical protein